MRTFRLAPKRVTVVDSHAASDGKFVLGGGRKGGREAVTFLPPLVIYGQGGEYSPAMREIFRDLAERA